MTEFPPASADLALTRAAYDAAADQYAEQTRNLLASKPFDRALLGAFADLVRPVDGGVLEVGCGQGRITAHLLDLGVRAAGMDLSPRMIELARALYPAVDFRVGSLECLDDSSASLAGIVAWYSLIHTPPQRIPDVLNEFYRVLRRQGHALLAFQASVESGAEVTPFDGRVARSYRWAPQRLAVELAEAGFRVQAVVRRAAQSDERCPHGYLLASKPG